MNTYNYHQYEIALVDIDSEKMNKVIYSLFTAASELNFRIAIIKNKGNEYEALNESGTFSCESNIFNLRQVLVDYDFVIEIGNPKTQIQSLSFKKTKTVLMYEKDSKEFLEYIISQFKIPEVKTVILAGGKSKRMGEDKGKLIYHGDYQTKSLVNFMTRFSKDVFLSVRTDQQNSEHIKGMKTIPDTFPSVGPISGILSAMNFDNSCAWMVIAVDLPYLDETTINKLLEKRNPFKVATCFKNPVKGWPEPLCTIWEPKSRLKLHQFLGMDRKCPRKILFNSEIELIELEQKNALDNCNTKIDYLEAKKYLEENNERS